MAALNNTPKLFFQNTLVLRHTSERSFPELEKAPELISSQKLRDEG